MSFNNNLMKHSARLICAASFGLLLTACSDNNFIADAPLLVEAEDVLQDPLVEPEELEPLVPALSPAQAATQLGGGFNAAFSALSTDTPLDPVPGDIINIDPTADPIDITNPN